MEEKAQVSMEFLLIIAGIILVASVVGLILKKAVFAPVSEQIAKEAPEKIEWI